MVLLAFLILLTNIPPQRLTEGKKRIVYLSLPLSKFSADFNPYVQSRRIAFLFLLKNADIIS